MIARDEQRERAIERLSSHLLETGLSAASLRQLATAAGVSDRMLLYYFDDKAEVLAAVMQRLAGGMAAQLDQVAGEGERLPRSVLAARCAELVVTDEFRPYMALWIEAVAAAARDEAPFAAIVRQVTEGFLAWIESRLDLPEGVDPKGAAAMILALVDGLALVEICTGDDRARRAVAILGDDR